MGVRSGIAVDLGTVNSLVHVLGHGLVLDEPSAIALSQPSGRVVGVGLAAEALAGREPAGVRVVHPLRDGVISDLGAATNMLRAFLHRARFHTSAVRPHAVLCVPSGATTIEREALVAAAAFGHGRLDVRLVGEPVAAALSAGARPGSADGLFVLDVGGGTTEAAVVVGARIVAYRSLRLGGNAMDEAVGRAVREVLRLRIGHREAEQLKMELGLTRGACGSAVVVAGLDLASLSLREVEVPAELVAAALEQSVGAIVDMVSELCSEMPPDLARDVLDRGVHVAGGGALLPGLTQRIDTEVGVGTVVVDEPLRAVVRGAARLLEESFDALEKTERSGRPVREKRVTTRRGARISF
jgi:rod shape-determining protein MreB and related proteins